MPRAGRDAQSRERCTEQGEIHRAGEDAQNREGCIEQGEMSRAGKTVTEGDLTSKGL